MQHVTLQLAILSREMHSKQTHRLHLRTQAEMNTGLADQLAFAEEARRVAEELAKARLAETAALKKRLAAAEKAQTAAERRAAEGELVRRKLHNTILVRALLHALQLDWMTFS